MSTSSPVGALRSSRRSTRPESHRESRLNSFVSLDVDGTVESEDDEGGGDDIAPIDFRPETSRMAQRFVQARRACLSNDILRLRRLVNQGLDVNWRDEAGMSLLHISAAVGFSEITDLLLTCGAKEGRFATLNATDQYGDTPLHYACSGGFLEVRGGIRICCRPLPVVSAAGSQEESHF